jgi:DHA1 family bicyclomycin/chloramphenicol resistance-like MFS transporter
LDGYTIDMPIPHSSVAFTLMLGALAALPPLGIDMSLPALPSIASGLDTSATAAGTTLSIFLIGFAIAPLLFGPLSDRFGRRPVLLAGVAVFAAAGLFCWQAPSIAWLLAGRLIQGMGAGVGAAMPLAIIRDLFTDGAARTRLSYVTVVLSVAPLIAPSLGSAVIPLGGWRGIYLVLGITSTLLGFLALFGFSESMDPDRRQSLQPIQLLIRYRRVLGHRVSLGFSLVNALSFACMFAFISGSPLVLIGGRGFSTVAFSAVFACAGFGTICGAFLNGQLAKRGVASSRILAWGLSLGTVSTLTLVALSVTGHDSIAALVPLLMASNATYGLVGPNASHEALQPMPDAAGIASAVLRCIQMMAGAGASALVPALYHGHSSVPMTGVMAGCAIAALLVYMLGLRRTEAVFADAVVSPAE